MADARLKNPRPAAQRSEGVVMWGDITPQLPPSWRPVGNVQQLGDGNAVFVIKGTPPGRRSGSAFSVLALTDGKIGRVLQEAGDNPKPATFATAIRAREFARVFAQAARDAGGQGE